MTALRRFYAYDPVVATVREKPRTIPSGFSSHPVSDPDFIAGLDAAVASAAAEGRNIGYWQDAIPASLLTGKTWQADTAAIMEGFLKLAVKTGDQCVTERIVADGPRAERRWVWNAVSTASVDNILVRDSAEGGAGRWLLMEPGMLMPLDGGALYDDPGDGSGTDDLPAAQAVANVAAAMGIPFAVGAIYHGTGKTRWNGKFSVPSGLQWIGNSKPCVIIDSRVSAYATPLVEARAVHRFVIGENEILTINSFSAHQGYGSSQILVRDGCTDFEIYKNRFNGPTQRCITILNCADFQVHNNRGLGYLNSFLRVTSDHVMDTISIDETDDNPIPVEDVRVYGNRCRGTATAGSTVAIANYALTFQALEHASDRISGLSVNDNRCSYSSGYGINISGKNVFNFEVRGNDTAHCDNGAAVWAERSGTGLMIQTSSGGPARRGVVYGNTDYGSWLGHWLNGLEGEALNVQDIVWSNNSASGNARGGFWLMHARNGVVTSCCYSECTGGGQSAAGGSGDGVWVFNCHNIKFSHLTACDNLGVPLRAEANCTNITCSDLVAENNGVSDAPVLAGTGNIEFDTKAGFHVKGINGLSLFHIAANGFIGVRNAAPSYPLDVLRDFGGQAAARFKSIVTPDGTDFAPQLATLTNTVVIVGDNQGGAGITVGFKDGGFGGFTFTNEASDNLAAIIYDDTADGLIFKIAGNEKMRLGDNGWLSLNTGAAASYPLDVARTAGGQCAARFKAIVSPGEDFLPNLANTMNTLAVVGNNSGGAGITIGFEDGGHGGIVFANEQSATLAAVVYDDTADALLLKTNNVERVRLTDDGRLGIGTAPTYQLDVLKTGVNTAGQVTSISTGYSNFTPVLNSAYSSFVVKGNLNGYAGISICSPNVGARTGSIAFADETATNCAISFDHANKILYIYIDGAAIASFSAANGITNFIP